MLNPRFLGEKGKTCWQLLIGLTMMVVILLGPSRVYPEPKHALALHGKPKYPSDFSHFDYVNPQAPKGGKIRYSAIGTFDSLNGYILKGVAASNLTILYDTLTVQSLDEAFTEYGLIAESMEVADDQRWVTYKIRKQARFHDGTTITPEDVVYTLDFLKTQGHPRYQVYFGDIVNAEAIGPRSVRFNFRAAGNRELPLIAGQMPVLPKHYWSQIESNRSTLQPPLGSGPYRVESIQQGRSIVYARVKDYWAADLPVRRGHYNFDFLQYDYYRDRTVAREAFKAGDFDIQIENTSKAWATAYNVSAVQQGLIQRVEIAHEKPTGMQAFVFNTRRPIFKNQQVRQALGYAFDFEWTNAKLFYGAYTRTESYFSNSELASTGLPSKAELAILAPFQKQLSSEVFNQQYRAPSTDGSGTLRANLRKAVTLLQQAGWKVQNGSLREVKSSKPMEFEILLVLRDFERICLPFQRNLKRLGIKAHIRVVDLAQYKRRLDHFDFDMILHTFSQSLSPGNEQRNFWSQTSATTPGSRNLAGVQDPIIDVLVEQLIHAPDRKSLIDHSRALDRVLLWGHYVIPNWHIRYDRVAFWDKIGRPKKSPKYGLGENTWWLDPAKVAALQARNLPQKKIK